MSTKVPASPAAEHRMNERLEEMKKKKLMLTIKREEQQDAHRVKRETGKEREREKRIYGRSVAAFFICSS